MIASPEPRRRRGFSLLHLAWLGIIGLSAATAGYLLTVPPDEAPRTVGTRQLVPPAEGGGPTAPVREVEAEPRAPPTSDDAGSAQAAESTPAGAQQAALPDSAEPEPAPELEPAPEPEPPPQPSQAIATQAPIAPPWRRFAAAFVADDGKPRIAVVLTGLGLSRSTTEAAIRQLPAGISLSFTPYAKELDVWVALARRYGHEVLLDLPMEPTTFPADDPGPQALLTALDSDQNLERLRWIIGRTEGFVGLSAVMGSRFTASERHLEPILAELKRRGLLFLDNRASDLSVAGAVSLRLNLPHAVNDRPLGYTRTSRVAIDARLVQVERVALTKGSAVAMGRPFPVTIERLRAWARNLEGRGLTLAPVSAVARQAAQ